MSWRMRTQELSSSSLHSPLSTFLFLSTHIAHLIFILERNGNWITLSGFMGISILREFHLRLVQIIFSTIVEVWK